MTTIGDFVTVQWAPSDDPTDTSPSWTDITSIVTNVDIRGGRADVFELYAPAIATIRCRNGTRSPAVAPTFAIDGFYKWRQINVTTTVGSLFYGYILSVEHDQSDAPGVGWVTLTCTDELGVMSRAEFRATAGATVSNVAYSLQLEAGVDAVVSQAGSLATSTVNGGSTAYFKYPDPDVEKPYAAYPDNVEGGPFVEQPSPTGNALAWLQDVMEAEFGTIQAPPSGHNLTALGRWYPLSIATGTTASMVFSDTPGVGEYSYMAESLQFTSTEENYYTRVVTSNALTAKISSASTGGTTLFAETLSRTSLAFIHDPWAEANASLWHTLFSTSKAYPKQLTVHMGTGGAGLESVATPVVAECALLGANLVTIECTAAGSTQKSYRCTVESYAHRIDDDHWFTTLGFGSQDRWRTAYGNGTTASTLFTLGTSEWGGPHIFAP